jgi:hypothetical protein
MTESEPVWPCALDAAVCIEQRLLYELDGLRDDCSVLDEKVLRWTGEDWREPKS